MNLAEIPLFAMLRGRLGHLSERQRVIAQNVAMGASTEAMPMATEGFREPSAAYRPTPPPSQ